MEKDFSTPSGSPQTGSDDDGKEISILLLGQSGTGKSTFINSCFNYLMFSSLEEVLKEELQVLIPAKILYEDILIGKQEGVKTLMTRFDPYKTHQTRNMVEVPIELPVSEKYRNPYDSKNEQFKAANAGTLGIFTYVFYTVIAEQKYKIRLIDTPGIGDNRGVKQDQENCSQILAYLSQLKELHGICILLTPTSTRLDPLLNYCMLQIFSRLDHSAVNNVCFVFTNTKGSDYGAGHTLTPLKELLKNIKKKNGLTIPLNPNNRFHFDNEAFSYVAAVKHGVNVKPLIHGSKEMSWNISVIEFWRLLTYVTQLKPHDLKKTISINDAIAMTKNMSEPVNEILQLIRINEGTLRQHTADNSDVKLSNEELVERMNQPFYDIAIQELGYPHTVCTDRNCTDVRVVNGIPKRHYKKKCCTRCLSIFISPEIVGNIALYTCSAFFWNADCKICGHSVNTHKRIYYETVVYEKKVEKNLQERIKDLKQQKQYVLQSSVMFDRYLQQNSMASIGNPIEDYLKYQLVSESAFHQDPNNETVQFLQKLLQEYEREKSNFQANRSSEGWNITANEIEERKKKLFCLSDFGPTFEKLYNLHKAGMNKDFEKREKILKCGPTGWFQKCIHIGVQAVQVGKAVVNALKPY